MVLSGSGEMVVVVEGTLEWGEDSVGRRMVPPAQQTYRARLPGIYLLREDSHTRRSESWTVRYIIHNSSTSTKN